eukprot:CAMPEP_0183379662 /NCGR_PEP_ID=MMETSP0164_2-20130417/125541_1 /TAXON_ID=221442 /ORGANISM="Coccolithus pelagicus ssp braarudi, Strain PLY182g" /LENGTH=94 /DNA_ID=CAMNT_0025557247 /DNA_START=527 /DNA_END=811 /DNA_ORIENTATION=+
MSLSGEAPREFGRAAQPSKPRGSDGVWRRRSLRGLVHSRGVDLEEGTELRTADGLRRREEARVRARVVCLVSQVLQRVGLGLVAPLRYAKGLEL